MQQIKILSKLQLQNLYGINVLRHVKDKTAKKKAAALLAVYVVLIAMLAIYMGAMTYGYIKIGFEDVIFPYLIMISGVFTFLLSIFKAGGILFQKKSHDMLCSLPLSDRAIVISRFIQMYVESLIFTLVIMLPGIIVYGVSLTPDFSFYIIGIIVALLLPMLPLSIASFFGALITAISSRMKRKSTVNIILSLALFLGIMAFASQGEAIEENLSVEAIKEMSDTILGLIKHIFPPAFYLGRAIQTQDFVQCILWEMFAFLIFFITITIISKYFQSICRHLYSTNAKHDYQMERLKIRSMKKALCNREFRHYFSCSIYVVNTIISPLLALIFSISMLVVGVDTLQKSAGLPFDIERGIPFIFGALFCVMPVTSSSISIEGKEWWIAKSLPISTKELLDGKLLFNVILLAPFYLISEIILCIAIKPTPIGLLWLVLIPAAMILFSSVFGLSVNLKFPVFDWTTEVTVVKQSAASLIGGIGAVLAVIIFSVPALIVPASYQTVANAATFIVVSCITYFMYCKNNAVNLQDL